VSGRSEKDDDKNGGAVLGHVIPRRRFTRWAVFYFVLYFCLPVLLLGLLVDVLLYAVFTGLFGRCYALFCLFG
jgi:hypothetical protein